MPVLCRQFLPQHGDIGDFDYDSVQTTHAQWEFIGKL
jgi:hypothetical protein